jgi:hypothetical protein
LLKREYRKNVHSIADKSLHDFRWRRQQPSPPHVINYLRHDSLFLFWQQNRAPRAPNVARQATISLETRCDFHRHPCCRRSQ